MDILFLLDRTKLLKGIVVNTRYHRDTWNYVYIPFNERELQFTGMSLSSNFKTNKIEILIERNIMKRSLSTADRKAG